MHASPTRTRPLMSGLVGLFLVSLAVRLAWIYLEAAQAVGGHAPERFLAVARNIVAGNGFVSVAGGQPNLFEPPLYPFFLSALFALFGESLLLVKVAQAVLDAGTTIVVFFIARALFDAVTAYVAGLLHSVYPIAFYSVADIGQETLFTFLLLLAVLALVSAGRTGRLAHFVAAGVLLGFASLTRTTAFFFLPFLVITLLGLRALGRLEAGRAVPKLLVATVPAFALMIVPWTMRNYIVSREFIPVAVSGYGEVFLQGSSEDFFTVEDKRTNIPRFLARLEATKGMRRPEGRTPKAYSDYLARAGWEMHKEQWERGGVAGVAWLYAVKFARLWYSTESGSNHTPIILVNLPVLLLAVAGMALSARSRGATTADWSIYALVAYFILLHWVTLPLHRYMAPVMPLLLTYGAYFLAALRPVRVLAGRLPGAT